MAEQTTIAVLQAENLRLRTQIKKLQDTPVAKVLQQLQELNEKFQSNQQEMLDILHGEYAV